MELQKGVSLYRTASKISNFTVQISSVIVVVISVKCYCLWIQPTTILMLTLKRGLFYFGSLPLLPTARNSYSFAHTTKLIHLFICFFDLFASFLLQA